MSSKPTNAEDAMSKLVKIEQRDAERKLVEPVAPPAGEKNDLTEAEYGQ